MMIRVVILFLMLGNAFAYGPYRVNGNFHHMIISGNIAAVKLHPTRGNSYMIVHADSSDIQANEFFIEDGWLKAHVGEGYPKYGSVTLDIWVNDLQTMNIKTSLPIQGHHIYSSGLSIYTMGSPEIDLSGHINLSHVRIGRRTRLVVNGVSSKHLVLQMRQAAYAQLQGNIGLCYLDIRGRSFLNMHWIKTYFLKFRLADETNVQLAGQVQVLDLEMYNHAKFGGRYLRVNRLFLKTSGFSEAQVSAVRSQHTYALDQSHIDYFNVPFLKTDLMVLGGETLDLREWNQRYAVNDDSFGD